MPKITNCTRCIDGQLLPDPDPHDWFCDDDLKLFCKAAEKYVTVACRPTNLEKECEVPDWCPKDYNSKDTKNGAKKEN